jgi:hypothetical protein
MALPSNSIMQVSFRGEFALQRILHVRTLELASGALGEFTPQSYQEAFIEAIRDDGPKDWVTSYLACLTSGYTLNQIRCQIVYPIRYAYSFVDFAPGKPGTRGPTGQGLLAANIEGSTAFAGRKQVANYKIGPIAAGDCTNGEIGNDLKAALLTYSGKFTQSVALTTPDDSVWVNGIWHKKTPGPAVDFNTFIEASPYNTVRGKTTRTVRRGE